MSIVRISTRLVGSDLRAWNRFSTGYRALGSHLSNHAPAQDLLSVRRTIAKAPKGELPPSIPAKRSSLRVNRLLLAYVLTIAAFQFAEDSGRQNREHSESHKCLVNAMNHFHWIRMNARNEKRRG